jgi:xanthine dehydrogenase accessory factor
MAGETKLWNFILDCLRRKEPVILMCVLESTGSSPGRHGFKMAVTLNEMTGSIGGGIMEHKFVEMAKEKLREDEVDPLLKKQIHSKKASRNQSGMICSGEQTIFLYRIKDKDKTTVEKIILSLNNFENGTLTITNDTFSYSDKTAERDYLFQMHKEDDFVYVEKTGIKNRLYIIGAGHCGLALSKIMSMMDFFIHLYDDRQELNTFEENTFVNEKKIIQDYSELKELIQQGPNVYIVIMTFGYRSDDIALRTLIHGEFNYIGVLGSRDKIKQLKDEWASDGIPASKLNKIHTPVGLKINSQTPAEIAVSIAAEIIAVKNGAKKPE